jgi:aspartyl protease family protein
MLRSRSATSAIEVGARLRAHALGLAGISALLVSIGVTAQTVSLSGSLGDKALLVIDGAPRSVAVGTTSNGVRLVSVNGGEAMVEVGGKRVALAIGGAQINLGGAASEGGGSRIVLAAQGGGHFVTGGTINGKSTQFVVDTGATFVAIGQAEADRLGIEYRNGQRGLGSTANGAVAVYRTILTSVRIGDVTVYNVEASVLQAPLGYVLLGNSFLSRFQMKRENDTLTLDKRF